GRGQPSQVVPPGQVRVEPGPLHQCPYPRQHLTGARGHRRAQQGVAAGGGPHQPQQHPDGGGLAGAVRAEEAVDGAPRHRQVHRVHRQRRPGSPAIPFGQAGSGDRQVASIGPAEPYGGPGAGDRQVAGTGPVEQPGETGPTGHSPSSAAAGSSATSASRSGVSAPSSTRPSSVSSTLNSEPESACPSGSNPRSASTFSWAASGRRTTSTRVQPSPTTVISVGGSSSIGSDGHRSSSVTVAPGGGLNRNCSGSGRSKLIWVKLASHAGSAPWPYTFTDSGRLCSASFATRICPIREASSRGVSTSSYASRPATRVVLSVLTSVLGSIAASSASAAACGLRAGPCCSGGAGMPSGSTRWLALFSELSQIHRSRPLRMMSAWLSVPSSATRTRSGPSYHSRRVFEPDHSEPRSAWPRSPESGSSG